MHFVSHRISITVAVASRQPIVYLSWFVFLYLFSVFGFFFASTALSLWVVRVVFIGMVVPCGVGLTEILSGFVRDGDIGCLALVGPVEVARADHKV